MYFIRNCWFPLSSLNSTMKLQCFSAYNMSCHITQCCTDHQMGFYPKYHCLTRWEESNIRKHFLINISHVFLLRDCPHIKWELALSLSQGKHIPFQHFFPWAFLLSFVWLFVFSCSACASLSLSLSLSAAAAELQLPLEFAQSKPALISNSSESHHLKKKNSKLSAAASLLM